MKMGIDKYFYIANIYISLLIKQKYRPKYISQ